MLHPSSPPAEEETYTISSLESKTVVQLKAICDADSIPYGSSDVKDKIIAVISKTKGLNYVESDLTGKSLTQLQAICDGRNITYTESNTEDELKSLILADV